MHKTMKRVVAAMIAASVLTPRTMWGDEAGKYCPDYKQVASNATGGDWVAGRLIYETLMTIMDPGTTTTTTLTTTVTGSAGVGSTSGGATVTTTHTTVSESPTTTVQEPVGYYRMNDGSTYRINCLTDIAEKLS